jgi:LPXTG-motif cell wall-anchored protein
VVGVWEQGNGSNTIIQSKSFANAAAVESSSGGASLPNTGANLTLPLGVAATLLLTGFVMVVLRRRTTKT